MTTKITLTFVLLAAALLGQDSGKAPDSAKAPDSKNPLTWGGFENTGSVTFGYRFTDVSGYQPKFQELINLRQGPRLLDFSLFGKAKDGENRFADDYSLTASGIGGDPFASGQLTVRKNRVYDLRVNYRQSYYYWDRNDAATLPNGLSGLTSNHNWATVRKLGSVNLLVHATNNLKFSFEYYRNSRDGETFTTRSLDYFGSSSTWGSFARADPYYVFAPFNEVSDRVTGGIDYSVRNWTVHYRLGYQIFEDAVNGQNLSSPLLSINVNDASTRKEPLNGVSWVDTRRLTTPVSEFSYTGKLLPQLDVRGGYLFYRYSGPASLNMSMDGIARTNSGGTTDGPYSVSLSTRANVTEPNQVVDQGLTYKVNEWWSAMFDYRYSHFTVDSNADFRSVNGTTVATGESQNQWRIVAHTLDLNMAFTPMASLLVRAGIRYANTDIRMLEDGAIDPIRTKHINTVWPIGSVYYQPVKMLTIRADVESTTNGTSYTRVTPHTDVGGRFVVRLRPTEKFYIEDTAVVRNRRLLDTDYRSTVRSNAFTATYEFTPKYSAFAGFGYDSLFASDFVSFLRGTAPFTNLAIRDQTVNRVWEGGLKIEPLRRLGINITGNYVRSTGMGEIAGELPLYGPMKFPYATGSIYYDVPQLGRVTLQLQRTYYLEQIVPGNNFSANLVTIAWTRGF
ncbi:MAG: hypothetical protein ABI833_15100 [Acidobacteriota bacterium]